MLNYNRIKWSDGRPCHLDFSTDWVYCRLTPDGVEVGTPPSDEVAAHEASQEVDGDSYTQRDH